VADDMGGLAQDNSATASSNYSPVKKAAGAATGLRREIAQAETSIKRLTLRA